MFKWDSKTKCYKVTDWELDYSVNRSVYRLAVMPEMCKILDFYDYGKRQYNGKYHYLQNKYYANSSAKLHYWLSKVIYCCKKLNIAYKIMRVTNSTFVIRIETDSLSPTEVVPNSQGYHADDPNRYKVDFTEFYNQYFQDNAVLN